MKKVMDHYRSIPNVSSWAQSSSTEAPKTVKDKWDHKGTSQHHAPFIEYLPEAYHTHSPIDPYAL
jgi:hypothetical protein